MFEMFFDLQLFDEEVSDTSTDNQSAETSTEESQQAELPEGFEGLEEYKDEILQELSESEQAEESDAEVPAPSQYKSKDEEISALKAQIDEMKRQGSQPTPQPAPQQTPPQVQRQQPIQPPPMQVTPEFMTAYKQATDQLAMLMTGMTQEQVNQLEFADDGDADLERWRYAQKLAADKVQADLQNARRTQAAQVQNFYNNRVAAVNAFNNFTAREMQESDFESVKNFATGELFNILPPNAQQTLAESYDRILNNSASPAEIMLIQNYFAQAKAIYHGKKNLPKNNKSARQAAATLPRVDNLNGSNANNYGGMTVRDLEKILDETTDFDKLDPKIKKMFEG